MLQFLHVEGEVGVWEWLILEGEMPPFGAEWLEAVAEHGVTKYHAIVELCKRETVALDVFECLWIGTEVGMTLMTEPVECASHIYFLLCCHVEQGEVYG